MSGAGQAWIGNRANYEEQIHSALLRRGPCHSTSWQSLSRNDTSNFPRDSRNYDFTVKEPSVCSLPTSQCNGCRTFAFNKWVSTNPGPRLRSSGSSSAVLPLQSFSTPKTTARVYAHRMRRGQPDGRGAQHNGAAERQSENKSRTYWKRHFWHDYQP